MLFFLIIFIFLEKKQYFIKVKDNFTTTRIIKYMSHNKLDKSRTQSYESFDIFTNDIRI